jgi:hypothetical protein
MRKHQTTTIERHSAKYLIMKSVGFCFCYVGAHFSVDEK